MNVVNKERELQDQLEDKDDEIERLKPKLISQAKEQEELGENSGEIEETREANVNLKTQLEEAKRIEEALKKQFDEKDKSCQNLEMEVVYLKKKVEK